MLGYETRLSPQLWAIYAASTMPDWLALPASPEESGLSRDELAALRLLRDRMEGTAARSVPGRVARGESPLDGDVQHALDALNDRVTRVYERAAPMLRAWEHSLTAPLPAWTTQMQRAMNAVFSAGVGETEDYRVPLFLLPSSAEHHGRKAALYLRFPPTTLECAGEPSDELLEALHFDLMHGATHACQGPLLDPLTEEYLASPAGQHTLAAYEGALRDAAGLPTPEAHWNRI